MSKVIVQGQAVQLWFATTICSSIQYDLACPCKNSRNISEIFLSLGLNVWKFCWNRFESWGEYHQDKKTFFIEKQGQGKKGERLDWIALGAFTSDVLVKGLPIPVITEVKREFVSFSLMGWLGLWGFLWWAPSAKRKDHHGVSSGWSSVWHRSNTGLSSTQYEQIPIILGVWPFWLTPFFFRSITFWWAYG